MKKIVFMIMITICATQIGCVKNQPSSMDQNSFSKSIDVSEIQQISDYSQVSSSISVNFSESSNETNIKKIEWEDLQIGKFKIGMSFSDFEKMEKRAPISIKKENEDDLEIANTTYIYGDYEIMFVADFCYWISTTNEKLLTPRGLSVGCSINKLIELYGDTEYKYDAVWEYNFEGGEDYTVFKVTIKDDKVSKIEVLSTM